jgi:hypothetical protein
MRITIGRGKDAHKFDAGSTVGERYKNGRDMIKYLGIPAKPSKEQIARMKHHA